MANKLQGKRVAIIGPQGSGKTVLAKFIASQFATGVLIDPTHDDWLGTHLTRYVPKHREYNPPEMDKVVARLVLKNWHTRSVDLFMLEEANRFLPNRKPLPRSISWLNDTVRHLKPATPDLAQQTGLTWVLLARRMVQLNTDLMELSQFQYIFRLTGVNDLRRCEDLHRGLGEIVESLPQFHFVERDLAKGTLEVHGPIPIQDAAPAETEVPPVVDESPPAA